MSIVPRSTYEAQTLLRASVEMESLRKQNAELTRINERLRRALGSRTEFDLSADGLPALLRPQI